MILVTGASGFLGSSALKYLDAKGYRVAGLVRKTSNLKRVKEYKHLLRYGDILEPDTLKNALEGCEILIHCAARSMDWGRKRDFEKANITGVKNLINACIERGKLKKLIYVSSANVSGFGKIGIPEAVNGVSGLKFSYSKSKLKGEKIARELCAKNGVELIILRPSAVYGPEDWKWSYEMIDHLAKSYWPLVKRGKALFTPLYIRNFCQALELAVNKKGVEGVYNVTDGVTVSWYEFCERIAFYLGVNPRYRNFPYPVAIGVAFLYEYFFKIFFPLKEPRITIYRVIRSSKNFHYSCNLIVERFGYIPDQNVDSHIKETVDWYRRVSLK